VWHINEVDGGYTIHVEDGTATSPVDGKLRATDVATTWEITKAKHDGAYRVSAAEGR